MLLVTVTIVAIGSGLAAYVGPGVAWPIAAMLLGVVALSAPLCLGTLALYCRGYRQTFFLGAFVGSLPLVRQIGGGTYVSWRGLALAIAANLASAVCCGWLALATRRFAERRGWHQSPSGKSNGLGK
jgi:hypothetical protein